MFFLIWIHVFANRSVWTQSCYILKIITQMLIKVFKVHVQKRTHKKKNTERWKTAFFKEKIENADLYRDALNKIISTHE